jgi:ribosome biogenesis GTPase A
MAIQWYPGHMHKARKEISEAMPQVDLVIEVLDARLPYSSANPHVKELCEGKPCIKVLNKSDLADPEITKMWQEYLEKEENVKSIPLSTLDKGLTRQLPDLCRRLLPDKEQSAKSIRTMIMGIPNVGKSTIINILAGKVLAKVGNEPAVTKRQQRINLKNGIVLSDTPGILWPKFDNQHSGYRLAVTGAVRDTAMEYEDVAMYAAEYMLEAYPERLIERYKLKQLPVSDIDLLEKIGSKRGCLRSGGIVDLHKASTIFLNELRSGTLGRLSVETPEMVVKEEAELEAIRIAKEAAEAAAEEKANRNRR